MVKTYNPYKLFAGSFIPNWILCRPELSSGSKLCFSKLCQLADDAGICSPSQKELSKDLGVSCRQIRRYLYDLTEFGVIRPIEPIKDEKGGTNSYEFPIHRWMPKEMTHDSLRQDKVSKGGWTYMSGGKGDIIEDGKEGKETEEEKTDGEPLSITPGHICPEVPESTDEEKVTHDSLRQDKVSKEGWTYMSAQQNEPSGKVDLTKRSGAQESPRQERVSGESGQNLTEGMGSAFLEKGDNIYNKYIYINTKKEKLKKRKKVEKLFDDFYSLYPLKKKRKVAYKKFDQLLKGKSEQDSESFVTMLINALQDQIRESELKKLAGVWRPSWRYPSSWLNQAGWEDQINLEEIEHATHTKAKSGWDYSAQYELGIAKQGKKTS